MPNYVYRCTSCGKCYEAYHRIDDRDSEMCCGILAERLIATASRPVIYNYYSENLDSFITGPAQRRRVMRERQVEEAG